MATAFMVAVLGGCSILDPVPPPASITVFDGGRAAAAAKLAGNTAAMTDRGTPTGCYSDSREPKCFAGDLGNAIDEADERRIVLLSRAREVSNGNAAFNALQYPLGAIALYEKLRGAPNHKLLLPAAIAAGAYGFVSSGVVDRERHYLREAFELHCAIVRSGPYLYLDNEINKSPTPAGQPPSLAELIARLDTGLSNFEAERIKVSFDLKGRSGTSAPSDARSRRVAEASGQGSGTAGNDKTSEVVDRWSRQAVTAQALRERLSKLKRSINDRGAFLRRDVVDITQQAQGLLSERVPLPQSPKDTADSLKAVQAALIAESGNDGTQSLDPVMPKTMQAGLSDASLKKAKDFASNQGLELQKAYAAANDWAAAHDERLQESSKETINLKCSQRLVAVPLRDAASQPAGTKPGTNNTAGKPTTNNAGGEQSPLPAAK